MRDGYELFKRPVLGGLEKSGDILSASPERVAELVHQALLDGPAGSLMIGAECTVSAAPIENIQAAVEAAHQGIH